MAPKQENRKLDDVTVYNFLVVWFCAAEKSLLDEVVADQDYNRWRELGLDVDLVRQRRSKIMDRLGLFREISSDACCSPPCAVADPECFDFLEEVVSSARNYLR